MIHITSFRADAVAYRSVLSSIGINAEPDEPLPEGVEETVTTTSDQDMLVALRRSLPRVMGADCYSVLRRPHL
jgi:hypothetical protein